MQGEQAQQGYGMQSPQQVPPWAQGAVGQGGFSSQAQPFGQQVDVPVAAVPVRRSVWAPGLR